MPPHNQAFHLYIYFQFLGPGNKNNAMKKLVYLFLFLGLFCSFQLQAQRFRAGLSACGVISDIKGADTRDFDTDFDKVGFAAGGIVNTQFNERNSFQFELNYITKGSMQRPDSLNNGYYKIVMNYVEVPLVFRHRMQFVLNKKPRTHLEFEIGASIGRMIRFKEIVDNYSQTFGIDNVNKTDVSILLGLNYNINEHLYFGLRYSNSVIPALKKNSISPYFQRFTFNNGNNMVFQLGVHYIFGKAAVIPSDGNEPAETPAPVEGQ